MSKRPACQTLSKALGISSITARAAQNLSKALAAVKRSKVDREVLKLYWKAEKIYWDYEQAYYLQVFQRFSKRRKEGG